MTLLTPERELKIREGYGIDGNESEIISELLAEIDALRRYSIEAYSSAKVRENTVHLHTEHYSRLINELNNTIEERDALRAENASFRNALEKMSDFECQIYVLKAENEHTAKLCAEGLHYNKQLKAENETVTAKWRNLADAIGNVNARAFHLDRENQKLRERNDTYKALLGIVMDRDWDWDCMSSEGGMRKLQEFRGKVEEALAQDNEKKGWRRDE